MASPFSAEKVELYSEDQAWELLKLLVDDLWTVDKLPEIVVGDWAKIDVYIPGEKYDSAITPYMMKGWLEFQLSIYRSYSIAKGGEAEARTLTDAEKEKLELVVEVKSGSSNQSASTQAILEKLGTAMVERMEPTHVLIALLTLIVTWGGVSTFRTWQNNKKEIKLKEIDSLTTLEAVRGNTAALSSIVDVLASDRDRSNIVEQAAEKVTVVSKLNEEADKAIEGLVKYTSKNDAVVNGVAIASDAAQVLTTKTRMTSEYEIVQGIYKIRKVDTNVATGFRVHLADPAGVEIVADVAELMTSLDDRDVIRRAEWEKIPVFLRLDVKKRRGQIVEATILSARKYEQETDGTWQ